MDVGETLGKAYFLPLVGLSWVTVIFVEDTSINDRPPLPETNPVQRVTALYPSSSVEQWRSGSGTGSTTEDWCS